MGKISQTDRAVTALEAKRDNILIKAKSETDALNMAIQELRAVAKPKAPRKPRVVAPKDGE